MSVQVTEHPIGDTGFSNWTFKLDEPVSPSDVELSDEQLDAACTLAKKYWRREQVQTLGGYAGTGKTTIIRHLSAWLPGAVVCAYTGKAASVLRRKGVDASTIHSVIYHPVQEGSRVTFKLADEMPPDVTGFIVDEASMVDEALHDDLRSFRLPIVFVGDHGQIEPISKNGEKPFNLMASPEHRLETIWRHAGDIPRFAEWLRHGKNARDFKPQTDAVRLISPREVTDQVLADVDQVICGFNRLRVDLNTRIRKLHGRTGVIEIGERVMCLRNSREVGIFNGMQYMVQAVNAIPPEIARLLGDTTLADRAIGLNIVDDGEIHSLMCDRQQFSQEKGPGSEAVRGLQSFAHAYAITGHKARAANGPESWCTSKRARCGITNGGHTPSLPGPENSLPGCWSRSHDHHRPPAPTAVHAPCGPARAALPCVQRGHRRYHRCRAPPGADRLHALLGMALGTEGEGRAPVTLANCWRTPIDLSICNFPTVANSATVEPLLLRPRGSC